MDSVFVVKIILFNLDNDRYFDYMQELIINGL